MKNLEVGMQAPDFTLLNQNSEEITLSDLKGNKIILFFYPKDNTPGCTAEACNLNDNYEKLINEGYKVLGISPDDVKSHKKFAEKYILSYSILANPEKDVLELYGVWVEKKMYGRSYMGVARTTFIIDEKGVIENIIRKVDTKNHTEQILK